MECAATLLKRDGLNAITPPRQTPAFVKLLKQMFSGFSALLWFGSLLCFLAFGIQQSEEPSSVKDNVRGESECHNMEARRILGEICSQVWGMYGYLVLDELR